MKGSSLGELKRGLASLTQLVPPLLAKERGIKGVRLINQAPKEKGKSSY
jgi:hypothetical protein